MFHILHAELFLQPQFLTQTEHTLVYLLLIAQLFLQYYRVPHRILKLNCNPNHVNMTSVINMTTGVRPALLATEPIFLFPHIPNYLVSSFMRDTGGPTAPEVSFSSLHTDIGRSDRTVVPYCGDCRYISF